VGHGDRQIRDEIHTERAEELRKTFERSGRSLPADAKRFFKLFTESTEEESQAAAQKMKKYVKKQPKKYQKFLLFHSLYFLVRSDSEMLLWPNSPLLVLIQCVDANMLYGDEDTTVTPLHHLADLADPWNYQIHERQLILAKQLIEHRADANAKSSPQNVTPLHKACFAGNVTNLEIVELLLKSGADPNVQDYEGKIAMQYAIPHAPSAAKFLLKWHKHTNVTITAESRVAFLASIRSLMIDLTNDLAWPEYNPEGVQTRFLLQQWREIEDMMVEGGY
jgi:hypothetical protein